MTVTDVNQLTAGGQYGHEDCGESCVASILADAGKTDTVRDIEYFDWKAGDDPADGTGGAVHVARLMAAGISAQAVNAIGWEALKASLLSRGLDRCMVAITSTHMGDPQAGSGIDHWILWAGGTTYMQPVGGRTLQYTDAAVASAEQSYYVVVNRQIGHSSPTPVESGSMTPNEVGAVIDLSIYASGRQFPPVGGAHDVAQADRDNLVNAVVTKSATLQDVVHQQTLTNPHR